MDESFRGYVPPPLPPEPPTSPRTHPGGLQPPVEPLQTAPQPPFEESLRPAACVVAHPPAPLLFLQFALVGDSHVGYWPQGNTEMIAGVAALAFANEHALGN